jgi:hypothetical protein
MEQRSLTIRQLTELSMHASSGTAHGSMLKPTVVAERGGIHAMHLAQKGDYLLSLPQNHRRGTKTGTRGKRIGASYTPL